MPLNLNPAFANAAPQQTIPCLEQFGARLSSIAAQAAAVDDRLLALSIRVFGGAPSNGQAGTDKPTPQPVPDGAVDALGSQVELLDRIVTSLSERAANLDRIA